jgi:hypothetical protein
VVRFQKLNKNTVAEEKHHFSGKNTEIGAIAKKKMNG